MNANYFFNAKLDLIYSGMDQYSWYLFLIITEYSQLSMIELESIPNNIKKKILNLQQNINLSIRIKNYILTSHFKHERMIS